MGIIRKFILFTVFLATGIAALAAFQSEKIYAGNHDVSTGNVVIDCSTDPNPVISGSSSSNHISITTASGHPAIVTLSNVNIDLSLGAGAAVSITGNGNVVIELVGTNTLKSGNGHAGIEKNSGSFLEIRGTGSLTAIGGANGAGIGGGQGGAGSNITINGGEVTANGGSYAAGIGGGGGQEGAGSNITINGGTVTANGGLIGSGNPGGAGIGGGAGGEGSKITITGGTVIATGGGDACGGAGIGGGGQGGAGSNITITGGTVTATGGAGGAGIGSGAASGLSGPSGAGSNITITGGTVTATGGAEGAGIGGGKRGAGSAIEITGGTVTAAGGADGAGIGGGQRGAGSNIEITGGIVTATGGNCGAGIGGGRSGTCSDITISNDAEVMVAGGNRYYVSESGATIGGGAAIGGGGQDRDVPGAEINPVISGLYTTGYIKKYAAGSSAAAMNNGTASQIGDTIWGTVPVPVSEPAPEQDKSKEAVITVSDNKPMAISTESKGDFKITYAHEIPFYGKGKITPEYFGGFTVSQDNATYNVTKIKVNKKKLRIQITGLSGADKNVVKMIKKATKGNDGLPFKCNPYYVRDTDKVTPKFNKKGELKSVKILINSKDYKPKKDEYSCDGSNNQILFKGQNLSGSYQTK